MRRKVSAYIELVTISASQTPLVSVALGLLCSSEVALPPDNPSIVKLIFAFAGMVLVISHIMVLNDYFDVEIDRKKGARRALAEIPRRLAGSLAVILLSLGLLFAWLTSPTYFAISLVLVLLSAAYSAPPIRYKERYPFSTIGEASGAFLLFWAGYSLSAPVDIRAIAVSLIPFLVLVVWRLKHEIRYVEFDTDTGKKTLAVVHGVERVKLLIRLCTLLIIALTIGLFFTGWFSASFLFFLVVFLSFVALISASSRAQTFWFKVRANLYWGFAYFFIVVAWILFS
jgi:4-hydroxybenzoate polyprenyltransferase